MPNLAHMVMEGLHAHQPHGQQQPRQAHQQSFSFPQPSMGAAGVYSWGSIPFQNPCLPQVPSLSPLALLAAAAQMTDCTACAQ